MKLLAAGGDVWGSTVNGSGFVRSLAVNAHVPYTACAAIYFSVASENGIYEIDFSNITAPTSICVFPPAEPEEVTLLDNGHVYAAVGQQGLAGNAGTGWAVLNSGLTTDSTHVWGGLTGYPASEDDVIRAAVNHSMRFSGRLYSSVWCSTDSGRSWAGLVDAGSNVNLNVYDGTESGSEAWWFNTGFAHAMLGRKQTAWTIPSLFSGAGGSGSPKTAVTHGGPRYKTCK